MSPGIICLGLNNSFKFPENAYIVKMQVVGMIKPNGPHVIVANAMNKYESTHTIIFCLFFLEKRLFAAHRIAALEKIQKIISVVVNLEKTRVPRLVAKIMVIINA